MICLLTQMAPLEVLILRIWTHPASAVTKLCLSGVASAMERQVDRCSIRPLREDWALELRFIVDYRNILCDTMLWSTVRAFPATEVNELAFTQKQLLHILLQLVLRQCRCRSRAPQLCSQSGINENAEASFEFRQVHFGAFNVV